MGGGIYDKAPGEPRLHRSRLTPTRGPHAVDCPDCMAPMGTLCYTYSTQVKYSRTTGRLLNKRRRVAPRPCPGRIQLAKDKGVYWCVIR